MTHKTALQIAHEWCGERDPIDLELAILRHMERCVLFEREECARIADAHAHEWQDKEPHTSDVAGRIADEIRNRIKPIPEGMP